MSFNSLLFLIFFLPSFYLLFVLTPKKYRKYPLLLASLLFYSLSGIHNLIILIGISIVNYVGTRWATRKEKSHILLNGLALWNLLTLFFYKYSNNYAFPLGISFYTFNNIMYIIDIRRNKQKVEKKFFNYLTYITSFIHISMGPLIKYKEYEERMTSLSPTIEEFEKGYTRFIEGLIKKVLLADNLGLLLLSVKNIEYISVLSCVSIPILYALELYIDFSSYTDMAIGLGKTVGITYPENFNKPYLATSVSDFWRRWHMTLTNFIKEYVYIPLGGNRVSKGKHIRNVLIVWILTGIWHGNTINYMIWGLYYGILLMIEKTFLSKKIDKFPNFIKHLYVMSIVIIGNIFFSMTSISEIASYFNHLFTEELINTNILFLIKENIVLLIASVIICINIPEWIEEKMKKKRIWNYIKPVFLMILLILTISYLVSGSYLPFLYNAF